MPRAIVAIRLVDLRLQNRSHVPRLNTNHRQARFRKSAKKPLRERPRFQPNPLEGLAGGHQNLEQRLRFARHFHFPHPPARIIHNAKRSSP